MTATQAYPKTLVVIRDCHAKNNLVVTARSADDEALYRKMAAKKQWKVAVRKPKREKQPTCDNCASMELRQTRDGANHRWCDLYGQWVPDTEQSPLCDHHSALKGAFSLTLTKAGQEGGAQ